jgi:putative endonuclease
MTNSRNTVLYTGYTDDLERRVWQHKSKEDRYSFTAKYNICKLVYFEEHQYVVNAIQREHSIKRWRRQWKLNLIKENNPDLKDLSIEWAIGLPE